MSYHLILMDFMIRLSTKIRNLIEGGLINYWIESEMDKVARISTGGGSNEKQNTYLEKYIQLQQPDL